MSRVPGAAAPVKYAEPDVYTVLLIVGVLLMLTACVIVYLDLTQNYGMTIGQLFTGAAVPQ